MVDYPIRLPRVLLEQPPAAQALLKGDDAHPALMGEALFYPYGSGSLILVRAAGQPENGLFPLHIHACGDCATGGDLPYVPAGSALVPLPSLSFHAGRAWAAFCLGTLPPLELIGRSVVLHHPDGRRIACGVITPLP